MPGPGGYWFCPLWSAVAAASSMPAGPSVSGKPWPRLTAPVRTASADISAKIVVPKGRMRRTPGSLSMVVTLASVVVELQDQLPAQDGGDPAVGGFLVD